MYVFPIVNVFRVLMSFHVHRENQNLHLVLENSIALTVSIMKSAIKGGREKQKKNLRSALISIPRIATLTHYYESLG